MDAHQGAADCRLEAELAAARARIEQRLSELVPGEPAPERLADAMRYSLLAPAKRVRGILAMLCCSHCGGNGDDALTAACALELVHAASLILDDLPAMDDATLRRGQSVCHKVYGEATATLAAIALMNRGFGVVAEDAVLPAASRAAIVGILARSIGTDGLTGGQEGDMHGTGHAGIEGVDWIHARKTGALFAATAEIGAVIAGAPHSRAVMRDFGMKLGLAFQGYDDLLDARAASAAVGKDTRRDDAKATMVALLGFDDALRRADAQMAAALAGDPALQQRDGPLAGYVTMLTRQVRGRLALG